MKPRRLPAWAEKMIDAHGPIAVYGHAEPDADAAARYRAVVERFRRRWHAELEPEVWSLFSIDGKLHYVEQAQRLLGLMIDLARYGSRTTLAAKREALAEVERVDAEIVELLGTLKKRLRHRRMLVDKHGIADGFNGDLMDALNDVFIRTGLEGWRSLVPYLEKAVRRYTLKVRRPTVEDLVEAFEYSQWSEPRLRDSDYMDVISSRKTQRDALIAMLVMLDQWQPYIAPVRLTDRARAAMFNVSHDVPADEAYTAAAIKKARADLRKLR